MSQVAHRIRIFLSSPGDVPDERSSANDIIENSLQFHDEIRDKVTLEIVAWDRPGAPPMEANLTPQEAINHNLPMPSSCDVVIVIFWARMGTPVSINGRRYQSGTEFEYFEAMEANHKTGRPRILVYRRLEKPTITLDDPQIEEKRTQYGRVVTFFQSQFGSGDTKEGLRGGYNPYETPDEFRKKLEDHLLHILKQLLKEVPSTDGQTSLELWQGSPFPGLRAFTRVDAPIFFGREQETDRLVERVRQHKFVAVVGASGSGKSSLVGAGLIPRLIRTSGENRWLTVTMTPDSAGKADPFVSAAQSLTRDLGIPADGLAEKLQENPKRLSEVVASTLNDKSEDVRLLLFIDQLEELFTVIGQSRENFIKALNLLVEHPRVHVVVTVRGDFYGECIAVSELATLMTNGTYPLSPPGLGALLEMITRPAARAGLAFEPSLPERILSDTGVEPGALALMAYTLDELYHASQMHSRLSFVTYESLGGVQGAIGKRSETVFESLDDVAKATLPKVFRELINIKEDGTATRRRIALAHVARDAAAKRLIDALTRARLLVTSRDSGNEPNVEVAHEALLRSWQRLADWIQIAQADIQLLRQVESAAKEWHTSGRPQYFLWQHERLQPVYEMLERLQIKTDELDARVRDFIRPEAERLLDDFIALNQSGTSMREAAYRQMSIIDRFDEIGENALKALLVAKKYATAKSVTDSIKKLIENTDKALSAATLVSAIREENTSRRYFPNDVQDLLGSSIPINSFLEVAVQTLAQAQYDQEVINKRLSETLEYMEDLALPLSTLRTQFEHDERAKDVINSILNVIHIRQKERREREEDAHKRRVEAQLRQQRKEEQLKEEQKRTEAETLLRQREKTEREKAEAIWSRREQNLHQIEQDTLQTLIGNYSGTTRNTSSQEIVNSAVDNIKKLVDMAFFDEVSLEIKREILNINHLDYNVRLTSAGRLTKTNSPLAMLALIEALNDKSAWVRLVAVRTLSTISDPLIDPFLVLATCDSDNDVAKMALSVVNSRKRKE